MEPLSQSLNASVRLRVALNSALVLSVLASGCVSDVSLEGSEVFEKSATDDGELAVRCLPSKNKGVVYALRVKPLSAGSEQLEARLVKWDPDARVVGVLSKSLLYDRHQRRVYPLSSLTIMPDGTPYRDPQAKYTIHEEFRCREVSGKDCHIITFEEGKLRFWEYGRTRDGEINESHLSRVLEEFACEYPGDNPGWKMLQKLPVGSRR